MRPLEEAEKQRLVEEFRACLEQWEDDAEQGEPVDLRTLLGEMAALKNEVRLESRQFKNALDELKSFGEALRAHNERLARDLDRARSEAAEGQRQAERRLLLGMLDLRDRLQAGTDAAAARRPSALARLVPGETRFAQALSEGLTLTLQRLDELLANLPGAVHRCARAAARPATHACGRRRGGARSSRRRRAARGQARIPTWRRAAARRRCHCQQEGNASMSETIVGIDLGTTNSEVAVVRDGRVEVIPVAGDVRILPSVVGIADDGALLVGEAAKNQYVLHPQRTVRSIKRRMGEAAHVAMGGRDYMPQEISAMILRRLKSLAEAHLGHDVTKAVITVPAFFSDAQRQATREAGEIAGLEVARIINEPTAAALAYESRHKGARKALVYDLGGGTFDVSVVNLEGDVVEVLASHGNNRLGGDDFDRKIVDLALDHLKQAHGIDASGFPTAMARLQRAAEAAKIALSDRPYATLAEEYLLEHNGLPVHLSLEVSRHDYEALIEPYIDETLDAVHVALSGARLTVSDIDEILLVGGATRTPLVARRLEEELKLQPRGEVDPDLCVAMGAAIQAALIAGARTQTVLVDVTPYTFGTGAVGELDGEPYPYCFVPLIRKNTPIPVSKSDVFYTMFDGQDKVDVTVYQGEDPDALNNIEIGRFMVEGLRNAPAGNPVVLSFALDLNGILQVTAREKQTGLECSITIDNAIARFEQDKLDEARSRVQALFGEEEQRAGAPEIESDRDGRRLRVEAHALVEKAERLLEQARAEDAEDLVDAIESVKDALAGEDAPLQSAMNNLADLLYYLES